MNKALVAAAFWAVGLAGPAMAADASPQAVSTACPARGSAVDAAAYTETAQGYCETRWNALVVAHKTGRRTHDEFINACARKCVGAAYGKKSGASLALIGLGLAAAGGAAGAAGGGGGAAPAAGGGDPTVGGHSASP